MHFNHSLCVALFVVVMTACSGTSASVGGTTDAAGVVPCSAEEDAGSFVCSLSMPVQGGLTGTLDGASGCGSRDGTAGSALVWRPSPLTAGMQVIAHFAASLPDDPVGTFPLAGLEIIKPSAAHDAGAAGDAGTSAWMTPSGACSLTITASICSPTSVSNARRVLSGTGTCSAPAAPETGTSAMPVTIGRFAFVGSWLR